MIPQATPMITINFQDHLTQVEYWTLARAKPPMIAPQVGVIKFTKPLAATKIMMEVSTDQPIPATIGDTIGEEIPANPEEDGTKNDKPICSR